MIAAIIIMLWCIIAAALLYWFADDIWFAADDLDDLFVAFAMFLYCIFWPVTIVVVLTTVARDLWRAHRC
ncbi:hypothetical protein [Sphingopyxis sp. GW247-27LB]|uniref:hypothetical protein n=1 Tax=Sphingopyxis sp. GW247-27LB TaxID=2012632 RepID=UPI000BA572C4|nr:hypothetical protein [Sphingopyxis sp. GW247-27LB]PAL23549.1 hypothetical protein CD928_05640 [Sphingopyxis sp. GW247-27LB]